MEQPGALNTRHSMRSPTRFGRTRSRSLTDVCLVALLLLSSSSSVSPPLLLLSLPPPRCLLLSSLPVSASLSPPPVVVVSPFCDMRTRLSPHYVERGETHTRTMKRGERHILEGAVMVLGYTPPIDANILKNTGTARCENLLTYLSHLPWFHIPLNPRPLLFFLPPSPPPTVRTPRRGGGCDSGPIEIPLTCR